MQFVSNTIELSEVVLGDFLRLIEGLLELELLAQE